ncbi:Golgi-associated RAB2 interactor protein 2 [Alligator mississippiensis]|uniref:Golgi-associated RAB2 interactor protein 2 n=1 Tax=Alligator mississippiensis TaxID=8496 RepID=UPI0028778A47|nr:Golgi-associated RAB2 interactor protein 2 [Alligator mississippiensis]
MGSHFTFKSFSTSKFSWSQTSIMGDLQRVLSQGEYAPLTCAPMFESNFIQVNKRGEPIYVHNRPNCVTIGICASSPSLDLPNVMLLAHTVPTPQQEAVSKFWKFSKQPSHKEQLVLSRSPYDKREFSFRFFPLKFVKLSIHNPEKCHLKLKLVNGRCYYLELCATPEKQHPLFLQWVRLISLLRFPPDGNSSAEVKVVYQNFSAQSTEEWQGTKSQSEKRDDHKEISKCPPIPEAEKEEPAKQASSKRVTISGIVGPIEESKRGMAVTSHSSLKQSMTQSTVQSEEQQCNDNLHEKKHRSKERKPSRENRSDSKIETNLHTSGRNEIFSQLFLSLPPQAVLQLCD